MPGGRLERRDRQHIARWLGEGRSYAEMARRLERPTSTVTREIGRNGGPAGYRPDVAQRAAERRARRRTPAPASPPPAPGDAYGREPAAVSGFEDRFTGVLVLTGVPRMPARVLACLYTSDSGSLTAAELAGRLRVSPASISAAVRYLDEQDLISRERDPGRRRDRYVIDDDIWYRALMASVRTNAMLADTVRHGAGVLGETTPAGARLDGMGAFLDRVSEDLTRAAERWQRVRREDAEG